jgi:hypothetical protein
VREQRAHFLVGGLSKVLVPLTHRAERPRRRQTNHLVGGGFEASAGFRSADRYGNDNARRTDLPQRGNRRLHGRTGRQPVVHDDHRFPGQVQRHATFPEGHLPTLQLRTLALDDAIDNRSRHAEMVDDVVVQHFDAAPGNCTHCQLALTRQPQLAHYENIERRREVVRHFVSDGDAATR